MALKPFYIGGTDIYDYQAATGFKRFNTLRASAVPRTEPAPLDEVHAVMRDLGFDFMQARAHVKQRAWLKRRST